MGLRALLTHVNISFFTCLSLDMTEKECQIPVAKQIQRYYRLVKSLVYRLFTYRKKHRDPTLNMRNAIFHFYATVHGGSECRIHLVHPLENLNSLT